MKVLDTYAHLHFHQCPRDPALTKTVLVPRAVNPSIPQVLRALWELFRGLVPEPALMPGTVLKVAGAWRLQDQRWQRFSQMPGWPAGGASSPQPGAQEPPGAAGWVEARMLSLLAFNSLRGPTPRHPPRPPPALNPALRFLKNSSFRGRPSLLLTRN